MLLQLRNAAMNGGGGRVRQNDYQQRSEQQASREAFERDVVLRLEQEYHDKF